jgi:hypothetical protein
MRQPLPPQSQKGFSGLLARKESPKVSILVLKPNPLIDAMIAQTIIVSGLN